MKYVEKNRNIEPHSESIIFLYLRDANGAPVPNKKIKIFAGPPPTGEPPYFVDDDPNNPNRRTDGNGKFQFIVAGGAPANRLDFFVQVLGADGKPESDPIHFPFPAGQARWVIVTLAPEEASSPGDDTGSPPLPTPEVNIDPRLASQVGVTVKPANVAPGQKYWKLLSAQYQDPSESGGNINIIIYVQDERGMPLPGVRVLQKFPGDVATGITDERGHYEFPMSGDSSFAPDRGEHGPYTAAVDGLPSDEVVGMGLPLRRHVQYILTFRRATAQVPVEPGPTPTPPPTGAVRGTIANAPAGARLVLRSAERTMDTLVAPDGTYSFTSVPPGTYTLELSGVGVIHSNLVVAANQTITFNYPVTSTPPTKKPLTHYLLFGPGTQPGTLTNLILALDYIIRFAPTVGFSVDEAANAENVTIVGGPGAVSIEAEQYLREKGAIVRRLQAPDSYALENLFQQLLASDSPYPP